MALFELKIENAFFERQRVINVQSAHYLEVLILCCESGVQHSDKLLSCAGSVAVHVDLGVELAEFLLGQVDLQRPEAAFDFFKSQDAVKVLIEEVKSRMDILASFCQFLRETFKWVHLCFQFPVLRNIIVADLVLLAFELDALHQNTALHFNVLLLTELVKVHLLLFGLFLEAIGLVDNLLVFKENLLNLRFQVDNLLIECFLIIGLNG